MRKTLIPTAIAVMVFAMSAFAATFSIEDSTLAAGEAEVISCADDVTYEFVGLGTFSFGPGAPGEWLVQGIDIEAEGCTDEAVSVVLLDTAGDEFEYANGQLSSGTASLDFFAADYLPVKEIGGVSIVLQSN